MGKKEVGGRAKGEWGATSKRDVRVSDRSSSRIKANITWSYVSVNSHQIDPHLSICIEYENVISDKQLLI